MKSKLKPVIQASKNEDLTYSFILSFNDGDKWKQIKAIIPQKIDLSEFRLFVRWLERLPQVWPWADAPWENVKFYLPLDFDDQDDPPIVRGKIKPPLTRAQYDVLKALLDARPGALSKSELEKRSGHPGAIKILRILRRDSDWAHVIMMPGKTRKGGYWVRYYLQEFSPPPETTSDHI